MASEGNNGSTNGSYGDSSFPAHQSNGAPVNSSQSEQPSKEEVAWYFVESYYTTMSRTPEKLYLFFNKRSRMVQGTEEQKANVSAGQKAIQDRIESLDFQDCKVRVTNVDSQASDENIVIQVIGEMSNNSKPHRKFVQTFVLAGQTNGYFVLNDIFRYIRDDEEEEEVVQEASEQETEAHSPHQEPVPAANDSALKSPNETQETVAHEPDVAEVDKKLEEVVHEEEIEESAAPAQANGTPVPAVVEEETRAPAVSAPEEPAVEEAPVAAAEEPVQVEEPKAPVPTPAPAKATPPVAAAPPKPAVPKSFSWAQLVAPKASVAPTTAPAPAPAAASQPKAAAPTPTAAQPKAAATSTPAPPVRLPSPAGSQQDGWQTAGADHNRSKSRPQAPIVGPDGKVRAFIKNVYASVDAEELKAHLNKFGELVYFDINRAKNSAFGEFKTLSGFQAAVAANPHSVSGIDDIVVEERRPAVPFNARGGARGGRGGFERPAGQGRGGGGAPRGVYGGANRGRGGTATPRGRGTTAA
ncbi:hypothetical protein FKW77_002101 [Venturia effusa]|uniref:NTF2 domain-containing protein n=1 Tax=Venturia effusa TaxID=50376 RepID=A0A517L8Q4_9PEZI|nr:hypothetical protein FKW77_002101 [Venturia effusa]